MEQENKKHPFIGLKLSELPFDEKSNNDFNLTNYDFEISEVKLKNKTVDSFEYGFLYGSSRNNWPAIFYSENNKIKVLTSIYSAGDFYGTIILNDVLIIIGHEGGVFYNVKTGEKKQILK